VPIVVDVLDESIDFVATPVGTGSGADEGEGLSCNEKATEEVADKETGADVYPVTLVELDNEDEVADDVSLIFKAADRISSKLMARLYVVGTRSLLTCIHGT